MSTAAIKGTVIIVCFHDFLLVILVFLRITIRIVVNDFFEMVIVMTNGEPFRLWTMTIVNNSNSLILSITKCHIGMHKIEIQYQLFEIV